MPLDPPAPSTLSADPDPSTPPALALLAPRCETVWRHTFLAQFTNPADREAIQRFGGLLYTATLAAGYVGTGIASSPPTTWTRWPMMSRDALVAVLREISDVPDHLVLGPENRHLCREATEWEGRLGDLPRRPGLRQTEPVHPQGPLHGIKIRNTASHCPRQRYG